MLKRLRTIAILVAVLAALSVAPAAASRSCGSTEHYAVTVTRGSVSCAKARLVVKDWATGKGVAHLFPAHSLWYYSLPGGWDCGVLEMGYSGCVRGGLGSLRHGFTYEATRNAHERLRMRLIG